MSESIDYAFKVTADDEVPCHLSEIKKGDQFYLVHNKTKSDLFTATDDAFQTNLNGEMIWSVPHEIYG